MLKKNIVKLLVAVALLVAVTGADIVGGANSWGITSEAYACAGSAGGGGGC